MMNLDGKPPAQEQQQRPGPQADLQSSDPYAVLGLERGATLREVKRAYFSLVRDHPPEDDPEAFKIIRAAYEKLRNPDVKSETDLFLFQAPYPWEPRKRRPHLDLDVHTEDVLVLLKQALLKSPDDYKDDYKTIRL